MSAAPKRKTQYPGKPAEKKNPDNVRDIGAAKRKITEISQALTKSVIDNPKAAKKAALVLAHWLNQPKPKKK